ncbi:hypothetical protein KAR91_30805 [Candidatus Pacearchaeota archaeon]|nr:hypothetical protein [Candidatus Pacearchaeota archaeon]
MTKYIVELEKGVWKARWSGDPGRTLVEENAKIFDSLKGAKISLAMARRFRPFKHAVIREVNNDHT